MRLNRDQKNFWFENSFLLLEGLFESESNQLSDWVDEVSSWPVDQNKWLTNFEMSNPNQLSRIENFVPYHRKLGQILTRGRIQELVSELMGEDAILYKERINFKQPGGGAHSAHQDGVAYESGSLKQFDSKLSPYISVLISVDEATENNGCLQVAKNWPLSKLDILPMERPLTSYPSFSKISNQIEEQIDWIQIPTKPGDVIFFTERLPHRSFSNESQMQRRILYGVYNALSEGDKRQQYYIDKRKNINDPRYMVGNPHAPSQNI